MVWVPAANLFVEKVATPEPLRGAVPRKVVPSMKVAVPVGGVPALPEKVAVKVSVVPKATFAFDVVKLTFVA